MIAVLVAGVVAYKQAGISRQQNKISLFELRYRTYNCILDCNNFANMILLLAKNGEDVIDVYKTTIYKKIYLSNAQQMDGRFLISEMMDYISELAKAEFLFPQDVAEYTKYLEAELIRIIINLFVNHQDYIETGKIALKEIIGTFESKNIGQKMREELYLISKPNLFKRYIKWGQRK